MLIIKDMISFTEDNHSIVLKLLRDTFENKKITAQKMSVSIPDYRDLIAVARGEKIVIEGLIMYI